MNKSILLLMLLSAPLLKAEPPATSSPNAAPFAVRAPSVCSWTIQIKQKGDRGDKPVETSAAGPQGGPLSAAQTPRLSQIQIDKAGSTRRILRKWTDGKVQDTWWLGTLCLAEFPSPDGPPYIDVINTAGPVGLIDNAGLSSALASGGDYNRSDFPELAWIEPSLLAGTETKNDNLYRIYRITSATSAPAKPSRRKDLTMPKSLEPPTDQSKPSAQETPATAVPGSTKTTVIKEAWIDASTGLPLSLTEGESTWSYSFSSGSTSLQLPTRFAEALQNYKQDLESAKYRRLP